jgi:hypothetical protein
MPQDEVLEWWATCNTQMRDMHAISMTATSGGTEMMSYSMPVLLWGQANQQSKAKAGQ